MGRRKWKPSPPIEYHRAPPCDICGDESDDLLPDGHRVCWKHDPRMSRAEHARILEYALGLHYIRPIFDPEGLVRAESMGSEYNTGPKGARVRVKVGDFLCVHDEVRGGFSFGRVASVSFVDWARSYVAWNDEVIAVTDVKTWAIPAAILADASDFWDDVKAREGAPFDSLAEATEWARPYVYSQVETRRRVDQFLTSTLGLEEVKWAAMMRQLDDCVVLGIWAEMCKGTVFGAGVRLRNVAWDIMAERTAAKVAQPSEPVKLSRRVMGVRHGRQDR